MRLIGMLDSPYVRRVAVSLQLLDLPFTHEALSVFRTFDAFAAINPVVKAPTLVCDDGTVLMDSTLILDYLEALAAPRHLLPRALPERQRALRLIGLALAGCEKAVQIVYERALRPPEKQHQPWVDRIHGQLHAAFDALEAELARSPLALGPQGPDQSVVTTAVVWYFAHDAVPQALTEARYPQLAALSRLAESLPAFRNAPHGDGIVATT